MVFHFVRLVGRLFILTPFSIHVRCCCCCCAYHSAHCFASTKKNSPLLSHFITVYFILIWFAYFLWCQTMDWSNTNFALNGTHLNDNGTAKRRRSRQFTFLVCLFLYFFSLHFFALLSFLSLSQYTHIHKHNQWIQESKKSLRKKQ